MVNKTQGNTGSWTKPHHLFVWIISLFFLIQPFESPGQDRVVEKVQVMNREVVVRVFDGRQPVSGLTEKDFVLFENGRKQPITSCRELQRALVTAEPVAEVAGEAVAAPKRGRLFLFLLWWNEKSTAWPKAWEYFLTNIYRSGDRIILSGGNQAVEIRNPEKQQEKLAAFFAKMDQALERRKLTKLNMIRELGRSAQEFHDSLVGLKMRASERALLEEFKMRYRGVLEEYRLVRLQAQPKLLTGLASELRSLEAEKWALVFMQNERLPMVHEKSRLFSAPMSQSTASQLGKFIDECDKRIIQAADMAVHVRDLRSLFTGANATFHLFLSDPEGEVLDTDQLRWMPAFSSWESAFRDISRDTGGRIQNSTQLGEALRQSAHQRDIFYALTFRPESPSELRSKLQVRVNRPGLKVVFARRLEAIEIQPLTITPPVWADGHLRFTLSGFLRETGADGLLSGNVRLQIGSEIPDKDPLEFAKSIRPSGEKAEVDMGLHFPAPGDYLLNIEAWDEIGDQTAHAHIKVNIPAAEPPPASVRNDEVAEVDPRLTPVLDKAADYCRRLKKAAFRFYCTEWVDETVLEKNRISRRMERNSRHLRYDYQVVGAGTIQEQRRLIRDGRKKVNVPNVKLDTRIKSHYSVFMPVTLLALENRSKYRYSLVETDRIKQRPCVVVDVDPLHLTESGITHGRVWIDIDDGSVIRIDVNPRGIQGSEAMIQAAKNMSARLELTATHWYLVSNKGIRFPSLTEFSEAYIFDKLSRTRVRTRAVPEKYGVVKYVREPYEERGRRRVEFYHLRQQYKNYRFFQVNSRVKVQ